MAGWLARSRADVPADDGWLGPAERACLAQLRVERRRTDWRLGRWTAKAAASAWLGVPLERLEVLAAADGAPAVWVDGAPGPVAISLSHRAGRALALVADPPAAVGCDLEVAEPRSDAFVRTWLAPEEQHQVRACGPVGRAHVATLCWCGKEAAAKVRRAGLRLDVRGAVVSAEGAGTLGGPARWRPLEVCLAEAADGRGTVRGWWRCEHPWLMVVAGEPSLRTPSPIAY